MSVLKNIQWIRESNKEINCVLISYYFRFSSILFYGLHLWHDGDNAIFGGKTFLIKLHIWTLNWILGSVETQIHPIYVHKADRLERGYYIPKSNPSLKEKQKLLLNKWASPSIRLLLLSRHVSGMIIPRGDTRWQHRFLAEVPVVHVTSSSNTTRRRD